MRIIAGKYKGRLIQTPGGLATRPTGNKVREALFDILQGEVGGARFVDLFAGSGAVGLEALSRGALSCVFVEEDRSALACLRANVATLADGAVTRVLPVPASRALALLGQEGAQADILFADPPYASKDWPALLQRLPSFGLLPPGGLLAVEHAAASPPACPAGLELGRTYRYGGTSLTLSRAAARPEPAGG